MSEAWSQRTAQRWQPDPCTLPFGWRSICRPAIQHSIHRGSLQRIGTRHFTDSTFVTFPSTIVTFMANAFAPRSYVHTSVRIGGNRRTVPSGFFTIGSVSVISLLLGAPHVA